MCYKYSIDTTPAELEEHYNAKLDGDFEKIYNVSGFSYKPLPVVTNEDPNKIQFLNWGLVPFTAKDQEKALKSRSYTLNARAETAFTTYPWKKIIIKKRCLIPATSFFESRHVGKEKYPYNIGIKRAKIFSFAGLWNEASFTDKHGKVTTWRTYSMLTTEANEMMKKIHNNPANPHRMPVILSKEDSHRWLQDIEKDEIESLMATFPEEKMHAHTVTKLVNATRQNSNVPEVLHIYSYPDLEDI